MRADTDVLTQEQRSLAEASNQKNRINTVPAMNWFYPKLSAHDYHLLRSPGPGLGNLLFPWARSEIHASRFGGKVIAPTWRNIKMGTILRREADARTYGDLFKHRSAAQLLTDLRLKVTLPRITEDSFFSSNVSGSLVVVEGMANYFKDLDGYEHLIQTRLGEISRTSVPQTDRFIGLHIRTGDFAAASPSGYVRNTRIDPNWFVGELARLRNVMGADWRAEIFTDDTTGTVVAAFAGIAGVTLAPAANALGDIIRLSRADHIVCSNSTFSLWSAFMSKGSVSTRYFELFEDYKIDSDAFKARIR